MEGNEACFSLKLEHDSCFYKWYWDEFLKNRAKPGQPCEPQFAAYRKCLETKFAKDEVLKLKASDVIKKA